MFSGFSQGGAMAYRAAARYRAAALIFCRGSATGHLESDGFLFRRYSSAAEHVMSGTPR